MMVAHGAPPIASTGARSEQRRSHTSADRRAPLVRTGPSPRRPSVIRILAPSSSAAVLVVHVILAVAGGQRPPTAITVFVRDARGRPDAGHRRPVPARQRVAADQPELPVLAAVVSDVIGIVGSKLLTRPRAVAAPDVVTATLVMPSAGPRMASSRSPDHAGGRSRRGGARRAEVRRLVGQPTPSASSGSPSASSRTRQGGQRRRRGRRRPWATRPTSCSTSRRR